MKVLIKEKIAQSGIDQLKEDFEVIDGTSWSVDELKKKIADFDALIIRSATQVDAELISLADNLKIVGRAGIGLDNVDVEAATKKGIMVANAPESNIVSAAEHALALMLSTARLIPRANTSLKSGKWERSKFEGVELYEKTLGVLGLGKIGTLVSTRALAFDMKVIAYDPYITEEKAKKMNIELVEIDELLKRSDIITVHLPKTNETLGMISAEQFKKMKDGVLIVNAARGGIIDEKALEDAVKSGKVWGAGLDVFSKEPMTDSPLFKLDELVVTPHLGASTLEAQDKAGITIAEQVAAGLKGEFVSYAVNIPVTAIDENIMPFLPLAEKLGKLLYNLVEAQMTPEVEILIAGQIADYDTDILSVAILKGLFEQVAHEPVTYVNASLIAKERGIEIKESKKEKTTDYLNLIIVRAKVDSKIVSVGGTVVGPKNQERFVNIYDFDIDMIPSEHMAFFRYKDVPGMIGKVGTILGKHGINIANMQVGRQKLGGEALMGINVDSDIAGDILEEIKKEAGIGDASIVTL